MTFSLAARCPDTGMFGVSVASGSIAVGNRCPWVRAKVGAVLTQNCTDIRLGPLGLDLLAAGNSAEHTIAKLVSQSEFPTVRQIAVVDQLGRTSFYNGPDIGTINAGWQGESCVAVGNTLSNPDVPRAMVRAFESTTEQPFAARLLAALDGGLAAGGEIRQVRAAALLITDKMPWPIVDLRVDFQKDPCRSLRQLWEQYEGRIDFFITQVMRPHELDS